MIRKKFIKFIAILGVVLLGGAVAVGWMPTALADDISYLFEARLKQRFGTLKPGDKLKGSFTVDTTTITIPSDIIFEKFGFFEITSFQVVDPKNGGTWTDVIVDDPRIVPGGGAAIIGNDIEAFDIEHGGGRLKHTCPKFSDPEIPECDAYLVGFHGDNSEVIGADGTSFAGVESIEQPLKDADGLTLADLGFGIVFEGDTEIFPPTTEDMSPAHPEEGNNFFSKMLLFTGGFYKDGKVFEEDFQGEPFATIHRVSVSLTPSPVFLDIDPGSDPNNIDVKSKDVIPVAILTTDDFDATTVDPGTVEFGPRGATEKHGVGHIGDVGGDEADDVVYHFSTRDSGIKCGDTTATLTGETFGGQPITGSDYIVTQGCK